MAIQWVRVLSEDDVFCEHLIADGDFVVGHVERFFDDAPTYAWAKNKRLGAFSTTDAAKAAVEAAQHS